MRVHWLFALAAAGALALPLHAQRPAVEIDDDDIKMTGCITRVTVPAAARPDLLIWSRGDIMLAGAAALSPHGDGSPGLAQRIFYWLDDEDDLSKYAGQRVEIEGDLEDFEEGEIEIERDGTFAEIRLELDGDEDEARVPLSWLGTHVADHDLKAHFAARKIDVDEVRVLGSCGDN